MKLAIASGLVFLAAALAAGPARAQETQTKLRRFAYVIGANDGGAERVQLRYAATDAEKVSKLLREIGGVASADVILETATSVEDIDRGLVALGKRLKEAKAPGVRIELILYYSGHSDESGLLIGGGKLEYKSLREKISALPADVQIAILDSCASGAFTRSKGGKHEPAFLIDESSQVTGYAFISSSSADEVAQESDRIAASFFTHYLISGLRGGADANRDGKVTLNEAYQFAFAETVARTESTVGGAQHPAYNMHLAGTGDIIMTDLRATTASVVLEASLEGRVFIRDAAGTLVIELNKTNTRHEIKLGLTPGTYSVTLKSGGVLLRAEVTLTANRASTLTAAAFGREKLEPATARGDAPGADDGEYTRQPLRVSFTPQISIGRAPTGKTLANVSLSILAGRGDALKGIELGGLLNIMNDDVVGLQVAGLGNFVGGSSRGARVAGLGNYTAGEHRGIIAGGLFNVTEGGGRGAAFAGLANYSGAFEGIAIAGLANYSGGSLDGVAVAGLANVSSGHVRGLQLGGIANVAGSIEGAQIGLVNASKGRVEGVQIGLINVASEADAAIGLVNVVGNGHRAAEVWSSDTAAISIGVKLGARLTYSVLAVGTDRDRFQVGAGLGVHHQIGLAYIDLDAIAFSVVDHKFGNLDVELLAKLRVAVGYQVISRLAVFAGPTATGAFDFDPDVEPNPDAMNISPFSGRVFVGDNVILRLTPGLFGGLRFAL